MMKASVLAPGRIAAMRPARLVMYIMLVLCAALWGLNQVATKVALADVPPLTQAALRSAGAALLLWAWSVHRGVPLWARDGTWRAGLLAGVLFGLEFGAMFTGLLYTTASRMIVFLYLAPFLVAVGMPFIAPAERLDRCPGRHHGQDRDGRYLSDEDPPEGKVGDGRKRGREPVRPQRVAVAGLGPEPGAQPFGPGQVQAEVIVVAHSQQAPVTGHREGNGQEEGRDQARDPEEGRAGQVLPSRSPQYPEAGRSQNHQTRDQGRPRSRNPGQQALDRHQGREADRRFDSPPLLLAAGAGDRAAGHQGPGNDQKHGEPAVEHPCQSPRS